MLDRLKLYRDQLAIIVAIIVAVNLVFGVVNEVMRAMSETLIAAMRSAGGLSLGLVSVLCLVLTAGLCVLGEPTTKHARAIAITDAILVSLGTLVALVNLIGVLLGPETTLASVLEAIGGGTDIALKLVAAVMLWFLARRVPSVAKPVPVSEPAPVVEPPRQSTTWSRESAAGVSWQSAKQAAQGAGQTQWRSGVSAPQLPEGATTATGAGPQERRPGSEGQAHAGPAQPIQPQASEGPAAKADRSLWNPPSR